MTTAEELVDLLDRLIIERVWQTRAGDNSSEVHLIKAELIEKLRPLTTSSEQLTADEVAEMVVAELERDHSDEWRHADIVAMIGYFARSKGRMGIDRFRTLLLGILNHAENREP